MGTIIKMILGMLFGGGSKTQNTVIDLIKSQVIGKDGAGLGKIVEMLQQKGMGDVVKSWVGGGKNLPVTPSQIAEGLGTDKLRALAAQSGLSVETLKAQLAKLLPKVIDQMTPGGKLPEQV